MVRVVAEMSRVRTTSLRHGDVVVGWTPLVHVLRGAGHDNGTWTVYLSGGITVECAAETMWLVDDVGRSDVPARMDAVRARMRVLLSSAMFCVASLTSLACRGDFYALGDTTDNHDDGDHDDLSHAGDAPHDGSSGGGLSGDDSVAPGGDSGGEDDPGGGSPDNQSGSGDGSESDESWGGVSPTSAEGGDDPGVGGTGSTGHPSTSGDGHGDSGDVADSGAGSDHVELAACIGICTEKWILAQESEWNGVLIPPSCRVAYYAAVHDVRRAECDLRCHDDWPVDDVGRAAAIQRRWDAIGARDCVFRASTSGSPAGTACSAAEVASCTHDGCAGYWHDEACWYVAPINESCESECEIHGGVDSATYHPGAPVAVELRPGITVDPARHGAECIEYSVTVVYQGTGVVPLVPAHDLACQMVCACQR